MSDAEPPDIDRGTAGASARREHERRRANREQRVRDKHPRLGGLRLALSADPTHETVWARGAGGEERVAELLGKHLDDHVVALHDRRIPGSRANIDHIVIAPSGVWVIDSKRYRGKVTVSSPLFGQAKLTIAGRDKSKLIDGLAKQVDLVKVVLAEVAPDVPVHGALCFVDSDLPLLGKLSFRGYPLLYPKALRQAHQRARAAGQRARALSELSSQRAFPAPEQTNAKLRDRRARRSVARPTSSSSRTPAACRGLARAGRGRAGSCSCPTARHGRTLSTASSPP